MIHDCQLFANRALPTLFLVSAGLLVSACTDNLITRFPPPDVALLQQAQQADPAITMADLDHGRKLYLTNCTACHSAEPIGRYSLSDWQVILPDMSAESKFNAKQGRDVSAYVLSYRRMLAQQSTR
ncbi:MAG: hypothetical protein CMJ19_05745 [Phycisphaeraceae bacterium]|nr:hypothetical protein [Phycisphaeraceae bacterium]